MVNDGRMARMFSTFIGDALARQDGKAMIIGMSTRATTTTRLEVSVHCHPMHPQRPIPSQLPLRPLTPKRKGQQRRDWRQLVLAHFCFAS
jgi:hypothetical protein